MCKTFYTDGEYQCNERSMRIMFYLEFNNGWNEIAGCMFHSEHGLTSYEHPSKKLKPVATTDSEGAMCGANFCVDSQSRKPPMMPRNGSEANLCTWGSQA